MSDTITFLIGFVLTAGLVWLSYIPDRRRWIFYTMHALMGLFTAVGALVTAVMIFLPIDKTHMDPYIQHVIGGLFGGITLSLFISQFGFIRRVLKRFVFRGLDPSATPHMWGLALFLSAYVLAVVAVAFLYFPQYILDALKQNPIQTVAPLNMLGFVIFSLLASGIFLRPVSASLAMLGLKTINLRTLGLMIGLGVVFCLISHVMETAMTPLISPQMQSILKAISDLFALKGPWYQTIPLAFMVAACAGIGEEILFRGLLQPIFGIVPVAALFALIHTHYGLTPLLLILFLLGLALGYIRRKYSTTAAIAVHTTFDFAALLIPMVLTQFH